VQPPTPDDATVKRFEASVDDFLASPRSVADVLELERLRVALRVGEERLFSGMLERGINPWVADSCGQLIAFRSGCLICGHADPPDPAFYTQNRVLRGLLQRTPERSPLRMCARCSEIGDNLSRIADIYEEEHAPVAGALPEFAAGTGDIDWLLANQALTSDASSAFLNSGDSALLRGTARFSLPANATAKFALFIVRPAVILEIWISADRGAFTVAGADGSEIPKRGRADGGWSCPLREPAVSQTIAFAITASAPLTVTHLQVLYIAGESPCGAAPAAPIAAAVGWRKSAVSGTFSAVDRTDTLKFAHALLARFMVRLAVDKGARPPLSFVFAAFLGGRPVFRRAYILPELDNGRRVWYRLDPPVEADTVKLFYIERCEAVRPHSVRLSFQSSSES
jgi:hypothetical protein